MDIVYILREWADNCLELRYSLRSLKNIEHDKVYIIWYKPEWVENVIHISAEDPYKIKSLNALHKINIACNYKNISDDFILMNDDFYITKETEIKYYNQWSIMDHYLEKRDRLQRGSYINNLYKTFQLFPRWKDFSLHTPIVYNKVKFLALQTKYDMTQWYLLRNLYCNHYWIVWEYLKDFKIRNLEEIPEELPTFLSNLDCLIVSEEFKALLESLFPDQWRYESKKERS